MYLRQYLRFSVVPALVLAVHDGTYALLMIPCWSHAGTRGGCGFVLAPGAAAPLDVDLRVRYPQQERRYWSACSYYFARGTRRPALTACIVLPAAWWNS